MSNIPNITISLAAEEQDLLLSAIGFATNRGCADEPDEPFTALEVEQLQMIHNLIVQARVEQDPDFERA